MTRARRFLAATSATALAAGFLYGAVAPAVANAEDLVPQADGVVAGIETVGPIATVPAAPGEQWPAAPLSVAVMPTGAVFSGDYPLLHVPTLVSVDKIGYRLLDLRSDRERVVVDGELIDGWDTISSKLDAGGLYEVQVEDRGAWSRVGTLKVGVDGTEPGAPVEAGGISVGSVRGLSSIGWASRPVPGPTGGTGVSLGWGAARDATPGLPDGWRLTLGTGSNWSTLREGGAQVEAVDVPDQAHATRKPGQTRATVRFAYPADELAEVEGFVVQRKVQGKEWRTAAKVGRSFAHPDVDARIKVPADGRVLVRVGLHAGGATVWGAPSRVVAKPPAQPLEPVSDGDIPTAGSESIVTAGELPDVVTLVGWGGEELHFIRNPLGVYEQTGGTAGFRNSLVFVAEGVWEFTDTQGVVTRFDKGYVVSVTGDARRSSTSTWDSQGRALTLTNEIGRTIRLGWAGSADCPSSAWTAHGFAAPPTGSLCSITYPDGDRVDIGYVAVGDDVQISLIKSTGNAGATFGWDSFGRIVSTRSALVNQVATIEPAAASVLTTVDYDAQGRAFRLNDQPAEVGGKSLSTVIEFPTVSEAALRDWLANPGEGTAEPGTISVTGAVGIDADQTTLMDPTTWQPITVRSSRGGSMSRILDGADGIKGTRDAAGRVTSYVQNELGLVTRAVGPSTTNAALVQERKFDTEYINGRDKPLEGLRAQVYPQPDFRGNPTSEFWRADYSRGGLSARWSSESPQASVQAVGVWTPGKDDDAAGKSRGWQFEVESSGAGATLLVGNQVCAGRTCTIADLPEGPKAVTIMVERAGASGWFSVNAAPVGADPRPLDSDAVAPGYALSTVSTVNDVLPGIPEGTITRYAFADPASGRATGLTTNGGVEMSMGYEPSGWKRVTSITMDSGRTQRTSYWGDNEQVALPAPCGGGIVTQSGQAKTITRQDGSAVTVYYDERAFERATVLLASDGSVVETQCYTYGIGGELLEQANYDAAGDMIEESTTTHAVGGDPRTTRVVISHGPGAPFNATGSVTESATIDLAGRLVTSTGRDGVRIDLTYDERGQVVRSVQTPPAGARTTPMVFDFAYSPADGALQSTSVNGVLAATIEQEPATGRITSITYSNGIVMSYTYGPNGQITDLVIVSPDERITRVSQSRIGNDFGRILTEETTVQGTQALDEARGYTYDPAGRLVSAVINEGGSKRTFDYEFAETQPAACASSYAGAGQDNLRTGGSRDGVDFRQCYDDRGRLVSTTDPWVTGGAAASEIEYDTAGRVTRITGQRAAAITWGSGTTVAQLHEIASDGTGLVSSRFDTFGGQVLDKTLTTDAGSTTVRYAGPYLLDVIDGQVDGTRAISYALPGGARVNTAPGATATMSISGIDGAALVTLPVPELGNGTAAAPGEAVGVAPRFGPYGEPLVAPSAADVTSDQVLPQRLWAAGSGQETLPGTSSITMLGARPYQPYLGVFLAPDPVVDSGTNLYSYTNGDPINSQDSSGRMSDEAVGGIIAGSGVLATLLGGLIGGRLGQLTGVRKLLQAESPQILAQTNKLSNSARLGFDIGTVIWNTAGIAATGYGTYLAVKASTDSQGGAIAAAVGASILTAYASWALYLGSNGPYFLKQRAARAATLGTSGTPKTDAALVYLFPPAIYYKAAKKAAQSAGKARGVDRASLGSVADMFEGLGTGKAVALPSATTPKVAQLSGSSHVEDLFAKSSSSIGEGVKVDMPHGSFGPTLTQEQWKLVGKLLE